MNRLAGRLAKTFISDWQNTKNSTIRSQYGLLSGVSSIIINLILAGVKGALGAVSGSVSLIADAVHSLSDVGTSLVIVLSFRFAKKQEPKSVHCFYVFFKWFQFRWSIDCVRNFLAE